MPKNTVNAVAEPTAQELEDNINVAVENLHTAISDFLDFASPSDLLEEIASHLRLHCEDDCVGGDIIPEDLTKN